MSNKTVYAIANDKVNSWEARDAGNGIFKPIKKIIPLSEYYQNIRRKFIIELINKDPLVPEKRICVKRNSLHLEQYSFKKEG